jgi:hypothetical protein
MTRAHARPHRVRVGMIWIAAVLLLGTVVLGVGYASGNRVAFDAGILVIMAGVLVGIQQIVVRHRA